MSRSFPLTRRVALLAALALGTGLAQAQSNVRILVGFPPGGGTDAIARILAEKLQPELGQAVVVDNKPGAGGQLAGQALKAAPADGSTVFLSHDHSVSILPLTMKNPGFDPAKDFVPVAGFATFVNAVALSGGTPARDFKAWIDSVKAAGGKATVGIPAPASTPQFAVQVIGKRYGLDLVAAPYRGSAPMMGDMLGNQIPAGVGSVPDFIENHKAGKLRVVAVMGTQRQAALPEVPTFSELGIKGFEDMPYYGIFAPAGTPAAAVDKLGAAVQKVIALPDVREKLSAMGLTVGYMSGAELGKREAAYREVWARIIKDSGYQPQ
ncbi:MAG: Twin-arginine translocation pathway signal [Hydrogenophaga sp. SCN 70-13]|mgnify:CR=1 FL=1|jgi:tripartite-type tricarboxylate transporter receptor subunit TctC|uniref:Bug family tripartite tricarboxylate transporter substrate binding protein n=1 Tax=Hydrogenophaga TaxID=47420 RepID=UPI00086F8EE4|nr:MULTISPECIES: Bug family tripartite tricarboxylate transporter substrate binding protein [unclassified Hydrogenophaga]MBN9372910.1 Bug family tripartite tricarboxylate transporter substrate binding protein [Hydrogenophaga sp.]ODT29809.1 MAG: Twin-arginine translocation pathway signal [Hydrogenophaga sp. SCN 70-13]OJV48554.1 MAG: Twin-arginine translocation pathway signal [Hydrogenophaga sp. 70-12]